MSRPSALARLGLLCTALGLVLGGAATLASAQPPPARTNKANSPDATKVVLRNATIHVGDGTVIEKGSILIEDGEIVAVTTEQISGGEELARFDLEGKVVTPGLIAADTRLGLVEIGLENSTHDDSRHDDEAIRAGYDPAPAINADSSLIAVQAVEGVTTAAVAPSGALVSGEVAWIDLRPGDHTGIVAASKVAVAANLGRAHQGSRAASLTELRRALEDAAWFRKNERNYDKGAARELAAHPLDLRALWPVLEGKVPLVVRAHRASDLLALIEVKKDFDLELTIVGAAEGWKVAEALAEAQVPVVLQTTHNLPTSYDNLGARLDNAALLHAAGVTVAIAHFDTHNARNLTQEAGIAVANGLDHGAAISAITRNVAIAYGMDAEYGTIEVGKVANLVIWDGADPLELSTWAEEVWIRGAPIDMRSRQTQLRERYRRPSP